MAWYWRANPELEEIAGVDGLTLGGPFDSQATAEHWLTETHEALADRGVQAVALYEEDRLVYGPMSLGAD
jgi:hypothetical protein